MVNDLSVGIRLEKPKYCPQPIIELLDKCFLESPERRPDFEEIKSNLHTAYNSLIAQIQPDRKTICEENADACPFPKINSVDNSMQCRYTAMLKQNAEQMKQSYIPMGKKNRYVSMNKCVPGHNSVSLECEVHVNAKNKSRQDLNVAHANKYHNNYIVCDKAMDENASFNDCKLKEGIENIELKKSLSAP